MRQWDKYDTQRIENNISKTKVNNFMLLKCGFNNRKKNKTI